MCPRYGPGWVYYLTQDRARPLAYYFEGYKRDAIVPGEGGRWQLRSKTGDSLLTLQPYTSGGDIQPEQKPLLHFQFLVDLPCSNAHLSLT